MVLYYFQQLQSTPKGNTSFVAKEGTKPHHKHSKSKNKRGLKKKNQKSELIISERNSPKKTHSKKNGYANGTTGKGTEFHRHYRGITNGENENNHHTGNNGCLLSNGYANRKSVEQSQPEKQHIKVSSLYVMWNLWFLVAPSFKSGALVQLLGPLFGHLIVATHENFQFQKSHQFSKTKQNCVSGHSEQHWFLEPPLQMKNNNTIFDSIQSWAQFFFHLVIWLLSYMSGYPSS